MAVDLSKVNISIYEFQRISKGDFNAGEVKLAGENKLAKMNNHVRQRGKNNEVISHAEVLAIKEALIKSLSANGVGEEALNNVRKELGLAPKSPSDTGLRYRNVLPLTRQQIREILDRNVVAIIVLDKLRSVCYIMRHDNEENKTTNSEQRPVLAGKGACRHPQKGLCRLQGRLDEICRRHEMPCA